MNKSLRLLSLLLTFLILPVALAIDYDKVTPAYEREYLQPNLKFYGSNLGNAVQYRNIAPSLESEGYYPIFQEDDEAVFSVNLNTTLTGQLYLNFICYDDLSGSYDSYNFLVADVPSTGLVGASKHIIIGTDIPISTYCYYYWTLTSGGNNYNSRQYYIFFKEALNSHWNYFRTIAISGSDYLDENTIRITLNDTAFYNHTKTKYLEDDATPGYSGTATDIVITNADGTKAYPYFIVKYKGGYYNFSRNTSNDTIIEIYVGENTTSKNLKLYYGLNRDIYYFGLNHIVSDEPNNPFAIHQIFGDWRWSKDFFDTYIGEFKKTEGREKADYVRGNRLNCHAEDDYIIKCKFNFSFNSTNINILHFKDGLSKNGGAPNTQLKVYADNKLLYFRTRSSSSYVRIYNLSGNYTQAGYSDGNSINTILLKENNLSLTYGDDTGKISIYDNRTKFTFDYIIFYSGGLWHEDINLYYIQEYPIGDYTITISNESETTLEMATITAYASYTTNLNDFIVGAQLETNTNGTFYCIDEDNNVLGSIKIYNEGEETAYTIEFAHTITNKTDFLNRDNFTYHCKFISSTGLTEAEGDNTTITFGSNKVYLSNIKPVNNKEFKDNYASFSLTGERNTTNTFDYFLYIYTATCEQEANGICYSYNCLYYEQVANGTNATSINYNNLVQLPDEDQVYCYRWFIDFSDNVTTTGNAVRYFRIKVSEKTIETYQDFVDWDLVEIDANYSSQKLLENPLYYLADWLYTNYIEDSDSEFLRTTMNYVFIFIWNFYFVAFAIALAIYREFENLYIAMAFGIFSLIVFSYIGWVESWLATAIIIAFVLGVTIKLWRG